MQVVRRADVAVPGAGGQDEDIREPEPLQHLLRANAQLIDDLDGKTLASASSKGLPKSFKGTKTAQANEVGKQLAAAAKQAGIEACVFDRAGYLYHGRVKALAEGAREGGLEF